jgi:hypothetical protein
MQGITQRILQGIPCVIPLGTAPEGSLGDPLGGIPWGTPWATPWGIPWRIPCRGTNPSMGGSGGGGSFQGRSGGPEEASPLNPTMPRRFEMELLSGARSRVLEDPT